MAKKKVLKKKKKATKKSTKFYIPELQPPKGLVPDKVRPDCWTTPELAKEYENALNLIDPLPTPNKPWYKRLFNFFFF